MEVAGMDIAQGVLQQEVRSEYVNSLTLHKLLYLHYVMFDG